MCNYAARHSLLVDCFPVAIAEPYA
jgi:hypothetical protein